MPSPQIENGYIRIANELFKAIRMAKLYPSERCVFDFILEKTYGFNKKEDWISLSQFSAACNIERPEVCRTLKKLKGKNIIIKNGNQISINKNYSNWVLANKPLANKPLANKPRGVGILANQVLANKPHTKDTITKDTITKDKVSDAASEIISYWNKEYGKSYKSSAGFSSNLTEWLKIYSLEEIKQAISNIRHHFYKRDIDIVVFFRRKNPNREPVDNIGEFLNYNPEIINNSKEVKIYKIR